MNIEENPNIISKELVITSRETEVQIALLEDKKLREIHREKKTEECAVGDIFFFFFLLIFFVIISSFLNVSC
jgi:hypothetical protein